MKPMEIKPMLPNRPLLYSPLPEENENKEKVTPLFLSIRATSPPHRFNHRHRRLSPVQLSSATRNQSLSPVTPPKEFGWSNSAACCPSPDNSSEWSADTDAEVHTPTKLVPLDFPHPSIVSPTSTPPLEMMGPRPLLHSPQGIETNASFLPRLKTERFDHHITPLEPLKNSVALNELSCGEDVFDDESSDEDAIELEHSFGETEFNSITNFTRTADRTKSVSRFPPKSPVYMLMSPHHDGGFQVIKGLGMGGYASVLLCEHVSTSKLYAMKVIAKKRVSKMGDRVRIKRELHALTETKPSPFLLHCYSAFESRSALFFVCDYFEGGDLFYHLSAQSKAGFRGFSEDEIRITLAEVAMGITHLHKNNYIHRDIKAENIMIDKNGHAKIIDFGLAKGIPRSGAEMGLFEFPLSVSGSLIYMPPELLKTGQGGRHTDWWAYGVLAHELLVGRTPWSTLNNKKVIKKEIKTLKIQPPLKLSPPAGLLVTSLLCRNPSQRLGTSSPVTSAPYFHSIDWSKLQRCEYDTFFSGNKYVEAATDQVAMDKKEQLLLTHSVESGGHVSDIDDISAPPPPPAPSPVPLCKKKSIDCKRALEAYEALSQEVYTEKNINENNVSKDRSSGCTSNGRDSSVSGDSIDDKSKFWTLGLETLFVHPPVVKAE